MVSTDLEQESAPPLPSRSIRASPVSTTLVLVMAEAHAGSSSGLRGCSTSVHACSGLRGVTFLALHTKSTLWTQDQNISHKMIFSTKGQGKLPHLKLRLLQFGQDQSPGLPPAGAGANPPPPPPPRPFHWLSETVKLQNISIERVLMALAPRQTLDLEKHKGQGESPNTPLQYVDRVVYWNNFHLSYGEGFCEAQQEQQWSSFLLTQHLFQISKMENKA